MDGGTGVKIALKMIGGVVAAFILIALLTLVIQLDNGDTSHVTLSESVHYKLIDQTVIDGFVTVELQNDGNVATFEDWMDHFYFFAMGVLEDFVTLDSIQEIRIFEKSTFLDEDVKENVHITDVSLTEEMIFDLTITKEKAEQLDYKQMDSSTLTTPYKLFNQADVYSIHPDMFQNELSSEIQEGFVSGFKK